jgi:hypothetical protein
VVGVSGFGSVLRRSLLCAHSSVYVLFPTVHTVQFMFCFPLCTQFSICSVSHCAHSSVYVLIPTINRSAMLPAAVRSAMLPAAVRSAMLERQLVIFWQTGRQTLSVPAENCCWLKREASRSNLIEGRWVSSEVHLSRRISRTTPPPEPHNQPQ